MSKKRKLTEAEKLAPFAWDPQRSKHPIGRAYASPTVIRTLVFVPGYTCDEYDDAAGDTCDEYDEYDDAAGDTCDEYDEYDDAAGDTCDESDDAAGDTCDESDDAAGDTCDESDEEERQNEIQVETDTESESESDYKHSRAARRRYSSSLAVVEDFDVADFDLDKVVELFDEEQELFDEGQEENVVDGIERETLIKEINDLKEALKDTALNELKDELKDTALNELKDELKDTALNELRDELKDTALNELREELRLNRTGSKNSKYQRGEQFKCKFCPKLFRYKGSFTGHIELVHASEPEICGMPPEEAVKNSMVFGVFN